MDPNQIEKSQQEEGQIGTQPISFDTGCGVIKYFSDDSVFTIIPREDDNGVIDIGGVADYIANQASGIKEEEFKSMFNSITNTLKYYDEEYISLEEIVRILRDKYIEFRNAQMSTDSDLYAYELDLDKISIQILAILLLKNQEKKVAM